MLVRIKRTSISLNGYGIDGFNTNQHNNLLPVGLMAQFVEHCTGIAEVMGSNPVGPEFFSSLISTTT